MGELFVWKATILKCTPVAGQRSCTIFNHKCIIQSNDVYSSVVVEVLGSSKWANWVCGWLIEWVTTRDAFENSIVKATGPWGQARGVRGQRQGQRSSRPRPKVSRLKSRPLNFWAQGYSTCRLDVTWRNKGVNGTNNVAILTLMYI